MFISLQVTESVERFKFRHKEITNEKRCWITKLAHRKLLIYDLRFSFHKPSIFEQVAGH